MKTIPVPINPQINIPQLRAELARRNIGHGRFAEVCGFSRVTLSNVLNERKIPSQITRIRIAAACSRLGLQHVYNAELDFALDAEVETADSFALVVIAR